MIHGCRECGDISEVASGGRAEIEIVRGGMPLDLPFHLCQRMLLLRCHCTFNIYRQWGKNVCDHFLKEGLLAELQAGMSRGC